MAEVLIMEVSSQEIASVITGSPILGHCNNHSSSISSKGLEGDEILEKSPERYPKRPCVREIDNIDAKLQRLKTAHSDLSEVVKCMGSDAVINTEFLTSFINLSTEHEFLKTKYLREYSERRRLYNELIELKGNIRVFCRCRPLSQEEIGNGSNIVVDLEGCGEGELHIPCTDSSKKLFKFDHVFKPEDDQEAVFAETLPIVTSVLDGYNVCIFAYGQTGTGKTFTMEGTAERRGVNYRTLEQLFKIGSERKGFMRYEMFVSMLEVYNEKIRDLLVENPTNPTKKLEIKQMAEGTQDVPGLVEARVCGTEQVWELMKSGSQARSVGSNNANEFSSRSHCLVRVGVKGENMVDGQRTRSNLWLVDLAGSERVKRVDVDGDRLKESQFINKSLSALGDVISALSSKTPHIPYRNSRLTHLLQNSLGGDCKTLMFVQISPSAADLNETRCSLNFASRVRGIEAGTARKQADLADLLKYKQNMVEKMKHDEKETRKNQEMMESLQLRLGAREHICRGLQDKVNYLESQLTEERKMRMRQESRAIATAAAAAFSKPSSSSTITKNKPPLAPPSLSNNTRLPLTRISNLMPLPPRAAGKPASSTLLQWSGGKENPGKCSAGKAKKVMMAARRGSIAAPIRSSPADAHHHSSSLQPRRRASIAGHVRSGRQSFAWDPQRMRRTFRSTGSPPLRRHQGTPRGGAAAEGTPGSKQRHGSAAGVVWSPLRFRTGKGGRKSISLLNSSARRC